MTPHEMRRHLTAEELDAAAEDRSALPAARAEHLGTCGACRRELAVVREVHGALSALGRYDPGPHFVAAVMSRVRLPAPWHARLRRLAWSGWAGAAAATVALSAAGLWAWFLAQPGVSLALLLRIGYAAVEDAVWRLVVGTGKLLFGSGFLPALFDAVRLLSQTEAMVVTGSFALLVLASAVTMWKLLETPGAALGSLRGS